MAETPKTNRSRIPVLVAACLALVTVTAIGAAHAGGTDSSSHGRALDDVSSPTLLPHKVASPSPEAISAVAERVATMADDRFAGLVVDEPRGRIRSYWVGKAPQGVVDLATGSSAVHVEVVTSAAYRRSELRDAGDRIMRSRLPGLRGLSSIAVKPDGSGLEVNFIDELPSQRERAAIAKIAVLPQEALEFRPDQGTIVPLPAQVNPTVASR